MTNLMTLPPVVPGTDYVHTLQGHTPAGVAATGFVDSDILTATIFRGQDLPSIFSPTVRWSDAASCRFELYAGGARTALLAGDTTYYLLVEVSRNGVTYAVAECILPTLPVPSRT